MRCDEVENLIADALATGTERSEIAIQPHLRECERCRGQFASLLKVARLTTQLSWHDLPVGFDERFRHRLAECGPHPGADALTLPIRLAFAVGSRGLAWLLFLIPSFGLVLALGRALGDGAGLAFDVTTSHLAGLASIMLLGVLLPAAVALLPNLPEGSRS